MNNFLNHSIIIKKLFSQKERPQNYELSYPWTFYFIEEHQSIENAYM